VTHPPTSTEARIPAVAHPLDERLVERVHAELAAYLAARRGDAEAVGAEFAEATDALAELVLSGGKRMRPRFAWWGWRGAGGDPDGPLAAGVIRAVSALELVQASALVHDDLIDASATRRGRPTMHIRFANQHRDGGWRGEPDRFGLAAAVLLGDLAFGWADDMLAAAELPEPVLRRARPVWAAMRTELIGGQFLDVAGQAGTTTTADQAGTTTTADQAGASPGAAGGVAPPAEEDAEAMLATAMRVNRFKTAAYTVERPLQLGAALAGAPERLVAAYRRFGADVGVAFQLRDDLLGVFGDPEVTGKPAGDDLREGKRTVLLALALRAARDRGDRVALDLLSRSVGNPELDGAGVGQVREVLGRLGVADRLERRITELTDSALAALADVEIAEPAATQLPELARAATRRHA
jgi:geranylgeranyl diphosphate synthase, type I